MLRQGLLQFVFGHRINKWQSKHLNLHSSVCETPVAVTQMPYSCALSASQSPCRPGALNSCSVYKAFLRHDRSAQKCQGINSPGENP